MASPIFTSTAARKPTPGKLRLFVALWPDERTQDAMYAEASRFSALGRRIPARNLHVTLAFIGSAAASQVRSISEVMREARPAACEFTMDRLGYFAQSRVLWAAPATVPPSLLAYQRRLSAGLGAAGFKMEKQAFRAHVTLLRDAVQPSPMQLGVALQVPWSVRDVALVQSETAPGGSRYQVINRSPAPG